VKRSPALIRLSRDHHHALDAARHEAAARVRAEHEEIRARIATVDSVDAAAELGVRLHDHVRFEERKLFALLEARLGEAELERLGAAIEAATRSSPADEEAS
jgi:hypothetical protein